MSDGWVKGQGFIKNLRALNQQKNEEGRLRREKKEAERLQRGYDRVSGGDVGYHHTLSGASGGTKYGDLIAPDDTGLKLGEYGSAERLSTGNIDFNDKEQVMRIQRALGVKEDGIFGPNTEAAYRQAINARRGELGSEQYAYGENPLVTAAENDGVYERDGIWGADSNQTFSDAGQSSVNQDPNYEGNFRNAPGAAMYAASDPDLEWEDKNFLQKIAASMPGVGGNPTIGQFWGNMFGGGGLTKKVK